MAEKNPAAGEHPFRHLLVRAFGGTRPSAAKKAEGADAEPGEEGTLDEDEVIDEQIEDVEEPEEVSEDADAKKAKKAAKAKKAVKAEDEKPAAENDDDDDDDKAKAAFARGLAAGIKRENARCKAIFSVEAAGVRPDIAAQLAFATRQSASEAVGVLTTAAAGGATGGLADRMASRSDPRPGADGGAPAGSVKPTFTERMAAAKKAAGIA